MGSAVNGHEITVIVPTIAPRQKMLAKALDSIKSQTHPASAVIVEEDVDREGPAVVRNRAIDKVETEWLAFLDDDDYLLPDHLAVLTQEQSDSGADVLWPWFKVEGGRDPFPMFRGRQWDHNDPHQVPITAMLRTVAVRSVGGFETVPEGDTHSDGNRAGEDWRLWLSLSDAGYRLRHVNRVTWVWRHHGRNTSGLPSRW